MEAEEHVLARLELHGPEELLVQVADLQPREGKRQQQRSSKRSDLQQQEN
jgi:hypothetical protein